MPTIPIEETDYAAGSGALSGDRVFKNTVPATTLREQTVNTLWHGLRSLVKQEQVSGDLTAANYAAELAAGFVNMSKAIRRAARRVRTVEIATILMTSAAYTMSLDKDIFVYKIGEDGNGPYVGGVVSPDYLDPTANDRRTILIINASSSVKYVSSAGGALTALAPNEACQFYGEPTGGNINWKPIGKDANNSGVISTKLVVSGSSSAAADMDWVRNENGRIMSISVPRFSATPSGASANIGIYDSAGLRLPAFLEAKYSNLSSRYFPVIVEISGVGVSVCRLFFDRSPTPANAGTSMVINRMDGSNFPSGQLVTVYAFEISYFLKQ